MSVDHLHATIDGLRRATTLAAVQVAVRSGARRVTHADGATFVLREDDQCFYADEDAMSPLWKGQRFPIASCVSGWAMLNHDVAIVPDITKDPRIPHDAYRPTFVKSLVMVPVGTREPIAAIGVYWSRLHRAGEAELCRLRRLADETAAALTRVGLDDAPFRPSLSTKTAK